MAKYVNKWGVINEADIRRDLDKAKNPKEARQILYDVFDATTAGMNIGVSEGDQNAVRRAIEYYGQRFNVPVEELLTYWSADKDIKSMNGSLKSAKEKSKEYLEGFFSNGYQPNHYNGQALKASGEKVTVNGKEQNVWNVGNTNSQVVWIGDGNNGGKYVSLYDYHKNYAPKSNNNSSVAGIAGQAAQNAVNAITNKTSGSGSGTTSKTPTQTHDDTYKSLYDNAMKKLDEYINPKVIGADEAAKLYGINYNEQAILDMYNEATNEYYDEKVAEQDSLRTNFARNNAQYYDQIADSYVDSYANAAPTATGKGTLAANALSTMLSAGQTNSENDYGMLQSIHGFEQDRAAELKNNPLLAREYYNKIGTYLSTLSAQKNAADVKQTVADLDAYSDRYASNRMYQAYQADSAATKYSGLAGAKIAKAGASSGSVSDWQAMWNYYNSIGGSDYASKKTNTILKDYTNSNGK